jgi:hypothetical protein
MASNLPIYLFHFEGHSSVCPFPHTGSDPSGCGCLSPRDLSNDVTSPLGDHAHKLCMRIPTHAFKQVKHTNMQEVLRKHIWKKKCQHINMFACKDERHHWLLGVPPDPLPRGVIPLSDPSALGCKSSKWPQRRSMAKPWD